MRRSHAKLHLKSAPQKRKFVMAKAISKSYTLDLEANAFARSRIVTHSNTASFSLKTTFYKTNNIYFRKNY